MYEHISCLITWKCLVKLLHKCQYCWSINDFTFYKLFGLDMLILVVSFISKIYIPREKLSVKEENISKELIILN